MPEENTGDALNMVEQIGVPVSCNLANTSAWMPTSLVPNGDGSCGKFPHLLDRITSYNVCYTKLLRNKP